MKAPFLLRSYKEELRTAIQIHCSFNHQLCHSPKLYSFPEVEILGWIAFSNFTILVSVEFKIFVVKHLINIIITYSLTYLIEKIINFGQYVNYKPENKQ